MPSRFLAFSLCALLASPLAQALPTAGAINSQLKNQFSDSTLVDNIAVFPHDGRQELRDTSSPWSAIGRLEIPGGFICTASLIGPNLILTSSHCVANEDETGVIQGNYVFKAQFRKGKYLAASGVKRIIHGGFLISNKSRKNDWAILVLQKRLGDQVGWLGLFNYDNEDLHTISDHFKLYLAGYATDFAGASKPAWQGNCSFHKNHLDGIVITHDCSTTNGASGSPMFIFNKNSEGKMQAGIVAIHSGNQFKADKEITQNGKVVTFSDDSANLAVPVSEFIATVRALRAQED